MRSVKEEDMSGSRSEMRAGGLEGEAERGDVDGLNPTAVGGQVDAAEVVRVAGDRLTGPAPVLRVAVDPVPGRRVVGGHEDSGDPADHADLVERQVLRPGRGLAEAQRVRRARGADLGPGRAAVGRVEQSVVES